MGNEFIRSMAYQERTTAEIIRMERINSNLVVLHFPTGPERYGEKDLKDNYTYLGKWQDYESGLLAVQPPT